MPVPPALPVQTAPCLALLDRRAKLAPQAPPVPKARRATSALRDCLGLPVRPDPRAAQALPAQPGPIAPFLAPRALPGPTAPCPARRDRLA